jgi:DNA-binding transcriptional LysR family regulator
MWLTSECHVPTIPQCSFTNNGISVANIASVDLKLLLVFEAVMKDRSVSKAAQRLGISQPAVSNSLAHLRLLLHDQLFVRQASEMRPTSKATKVAISVGRILSELRALFDPGAVDIATSFNLAVSDQACIVALPDLVAHLRAAAPGIHLRIHPKSNLTAFQQLDSADVDLALGIFEKVPSRFAKAVLYEDHYVCVMHKDNPLVGTGLTPDVFTSADHLAVVPSHEAVSTLDQHLKALKMKRNIVLNVSQSSAIPGILSRSPLLACVLDSVAKTFSPRELVSTPLPFEMKPMEVLALWSKARGRDPDVLWLRRRVIEACTRRKPF